MGKKQEPITASIASLKSMPTEYFEAKPQKAVGLS